MEIRWNRKCRKSQLLLSLSLCGIMRASEIYAKRLITRNVTSSSQKSSAAFVRVFGLTPDLSNSESLTWDEMQRSVTERHFLGKTLYREEKVSSAAFATQGRAFTSLRIRLGINLLSFLFLVINELLLVDIWVKFCVNIHAKNSCNRCLWICAWNIERANRGQSSKWNCDCAIFADWLMIESTFSVSYFYTFGPF